MSNIEPNYNYQVTTDGREYGIFHNHSKSNKTQLLTLNVDELADMVYKSMIEKDNLIKYLEDKINHVQQLINCKNKKVKPYGEELHFYQSMIFMYKDILEKIRNGQYE